MIDTERVALWAIKHGFATGHGDTQQDILEELDYQIKELQKDTVILDWIIQNKADVISPLFEGNRWSIEWFENKELYFCNGKDLRDCVRKAMEKENEHS